eukprot:TRINITY_DN1939_c0_g2_i1.p1 TRINITY_DN1939_c0_g2~~TRINITY_DN1939_c0_g2_i1.p1  ORF type:complete len:1264 (+),score=335.42 TRINITY_DN1939_c0_g2_i1:200-3793(+)
MVSDGKPRRKRREGSSVNMIWKLLCPNLSKLEMAGGGWQLYGILVLSLLRIWLMSATSRVVQKLDVNAMTRNQAEFWSGWREQLQLAVVSCIHRQTYKYVENSLAVAWRKKLTNIVHKKYFKNKNYYILAQQAAQGTDTSIGDPDERICEDAKDVATQLAHVFCEGIYASTAGTFFALQLGKLYGVQYALAPYLYLWSMFVITKKLAPLPIGKWVSETRTRFASYKTAHQMLVTNSEAVAALEGRDFEENTLQTRFKQAISKAREFHRVVLWYNFNESLAFTWFLRSFMTTFIITPHLFWQEAKPDLSSIANIAKLKGDIGHQFVLFVQSMIAAGTTAKMLKQLDRISGSASRVGDVLSALNAMPESDGDTVISGDLISFEHVDIVTPQGRTLVKDLSFSLKQGSSLLLTGHNGAGKSSIFRCLGGLWEHTTGTITKPGTAASADGHQKGGVYYLPQKPYNVRGTLTEQMAYPIKGAKLSDEKMREVLEKVDLLYLLDTYSDRTVNWDEILSLGEMQRLAIARLLFHEPSFAILDECTSAVSGEMERRLYEHVLKDAKTAYITISHRPVLKAYHDQLLTIGLPDAAYTLDVLNKPDFHHQTARGQVTKSSSPKGHTLKKLDSKHAKNASFAAFRKLIDIGLPHKKAARLAMAVTAVAIQVGLKVQTTKNLGEMMSTIFKQDKGEFLQLVFKSLGYAVAGGVMEQCVTYMEHDIAESMMEGLTTSFLKRYMKNNAFYKIGHLDKTIPDPQQRITSDLRALTNATAALIPQLLRPIVELCWFSYHIREMVGGKAVGFFGLYLAGGSVVIRMAMPEFRKITSEESSLEGLFKAGHARVKHHSESIAFYGGGVRELGIIHERFSDLMKHAQLRLWQTWKFNLVNGAIVREAPFLVQWILRNEFSKNVKDAEVISDGGEKLGRAQAFIFDATNQMFECMGQLLNFAEHLENLYGLVGRVSEMDKVLDSVHTQFPTLKKSVVKGSQYLGLRGADIVTPAGVTLARNMTLDIDASTMVTGRNGIGKTSLFRVMGGLWPLTKGEVILPEGKKIFLVPQQVFMVLGSLADQITYPKKIDTENQDETDKLTDLLRKVQLKDRIAEHGWEEVKQWEHILSLGEQQRIGMARLLYHKPDICVLDECTSAVSVNVEHLLYEEAVNLGITCITISQRLALTEFHPREINLSEEHADNWKLIEHKKDDDQDA